MNHITSIFKLADILHTPQGIALAGAFASSHQQLNNVLNEVKNCVDDLHSVSYLNSDQELISLPVKKSQYTTSISNQVNLFFLLDLDNLPDDLILGTTIYKNEEKNSTISSDELSTFSI